MRHSSFKEFIESYATSLEIKKVIIPKHLDIGIESSSKLDTQPSEFLLSLFRVIKGRYPITRKTPEPISLHKFAINKLAVRVFFDEDSTSNLSLLFYYNSIKGEEPRYTTHFGKKVPGAGSFGIVPIEVKLKDIIDLSIDKNRKLKSVTFKLDYKLGITLNCVAKCKQTKKSF